MKYILLNSAFAVLCTIVGVSVANAFAVPLWFGVALGFFVGTLPQWLPSVLGGTGERTLAGGRCAEWVSFALLVAVAAAVSAQGLLPALYGGLVRLESSIPLLFMAPALYATYLVLNRAGAVERRGSVLDQLAAALSGPPLALTLALALAVATGAVLLIRYVGLNHPPWEYLAAKFVDRGIIPPLTLVLFFWGALLLANKIWVLGRERRLMGAGGDGAGPRGGESALMRAHAQALASGEVGDTDDFLAMCGRRRRTSTSCPRYINWAIPILGFIGTVLGISLAADGIQNIIGSQGSLGDMSSELGQAIAPLGIAFDTTLIALSLSVFLMLLQTALQRWEDGVLVGYESRIRALSGQPSAGRQEG